jgi:hypothetical protein
MKVFQFKTTKIEGQIVAERNFDCKLWCACSVFQIQYF